MSRRYPDITETELFQRAAAEAREASHRYWAAGSWADKKYPPQPIPWWSETPQAGDYDLVERRQRRRGK